MQCRQEVINFDMKKDIDPTHIFCGTFGEVIEEWYCSLNKITKERGEILVVVAHPSVINDILAFRPVWDDIAFHNNMPDDNTTCWRAGKRRFWSSDTTTASVWANRYFSYASDNSKYYDGNIKACKKRFIDRIDFYCQKGDFQMNLNWENLILNKRR